MTNNFTTVGDIIFCSLCLVRDVKMFEMSPEMYRIYSEMIPAHKLCIEEMHACYECTHLLHKYGRYKKKCQTAYNILLSYIDGYTEVTEELLSNIDRKQTKLESKLTYVGIVTECHIPNLQSEVPILDNIPVNKTNQSEDSIQFQESDVNFIIKKELEPTIDICNVHNFINSDKQRLNVVNVKIEYVKNTCSDNEDNFHSENVLETKYPETVIFKDNMGVINSENIKEESESMNTQEKEGHNIIQDHEREHLESDSDIQSDNDSVKLIENTIKDPLKHKSNDSEENSLKIKRQKDTSRKKRNTSMNKVQKKRKTKLNEGPEKKITDNVIFSNINYNLIPKLDLSYYDNYVTIIPLTAEDARCEILLRKNSINYKKSVYKCEFCFRGFISEDTFQSHMKKHSLETGSFECDICKLRFMNKNSLRIHQGSFHTRKFVCKICPYVCYNSTQARSHISIHKGKEYPCKMCGEKFRYPNSLASHIRITHELELACDLCGGMFASAKGLERHKNLVHKKENNKYLGPKCDDCNVHFSTRKAWTRHLILCSKHKLSNGCGVCGEVFPDALTLREHARSHGGRFYSYHVKEHTRKKATVQLPATCVHCDVTLSNMKMYKEHMTTEHPDTESAKTLVKVQEKNFICEVCGMTFMHPSSLTSHQRKHTDEKIFNCSECGKGFKTKQGYMAHESAHTNINKHTCHICNREFCDKNRLLKHLKYHSADRPFKCTFCVSSFTFQCELKYHVMHVHNKVPWPKREKRIRKTDKKQKRDKD